MWVHKKFQTFMTHNFFADQLWNFPHLLYHTSYRIFQYMPRNDLICDRQLWTKLKIIVKGSGMKYLTSCGCIITIIHPKRSPRYCWSQNFFTSGSFFQMLMFGILMKLLTNIIYLEQTRNSQLLICWLLANGLTEPIQSVATVSASF